MSDKAKVPRRLTKLMFVAIGLLVLLATGCCQGQATMPADLSKIAGIKGAAPASSDSFRFVVMSDRTGGHVPGLWEQAVDQVNMLSPDFVMCVGDLIEGYTEDPAKLAGMWDEFVRITAKLNAPFLFCPGNHDTSTDLMVQDYVARWGVNGKTYYSFDYRDCHFVVLDSNTAKRLPAFADEQFTWLQADLAAAKDARHVFLFYHYHAWQDDPAFWRRLVGMVDKSKTTIFNGHWHCHTFENLDGIPVYSLSATGTVVDQGGREMGEFYSFAHVSVSDGAPTVAVLPVGDVLAGEFLTAAMVKQRNAMFKALEITPALSGGGMTMTLRQENSTDKPLTVLLDCSAVGPGAPAKVELAVPPHESRQTDLSVPCSPGMAHMPAVKASYTFVGGDGRPVTISRARALPTVLVAPSAKALVIDGDLSDWADPAATSLTVTDPNISPDDLSGTIRAACDGQSLYLAIDVRDECVYLDDLKVYQNDSVDLFWSVPADCASGRANAPTAGRVVLCVPKQGEAIEPWWRTEEGQIRPTGQAACRRTAGGYTYEMKVNLADLGALTPVRNGQEICWRPILNDRDVVKGSVADRERLYVSGQDGPFLSIIMQAPK
jgi:hypothetical protein